MDAYEVSISEGASGLALLASSDLFERTNDPTDLFTGRAFLRRSDQSTVALRFAAGCILGGFIYPVDRTL
jgi:hypothetical protein